MSRKVIVNQSVTNFYVVPHNVFYGHYVIEQQDIKKIGPQFFGISVA